MSVALKSRLMTAEEFAEIEDCGDFDLIQGELVPMPPPEPSFDHGVATMSLSARVSIFVEDNDLGLCFAAETRFVIEYDPDTAIGPDFAFLAKERVPSPRPKGFGRMAPDLILEVRSPSDREAKAVEKMERWIRAGVRLGWELDMKTRVLTVYRPNETTRTIDINGTIDGEDVLPGFTLPMRRLFPEYR